MSIYENPEYIDLLADEFCEEIENRKEHLQNIKALVKRIQDPMAKAALEELIDFILKD